MNRRGFLTGTISVMAMAAALKFSKPVVDNGTYQVSGYFIGDNGYDEFRRQSIKESIEFRTMRIRRGYKGYITGVEIIEDEVV